MSAQPARRSRGASDPAATGGSRHLSGQVSPGHVADAAFEQRPPRGEGPGQVTDDVSTAHWASGLIGAGARRQFRGHSWIFGSDERTRREVKSHVDPHPHPQVSSPAPAVVQARRLGPDPATSGQHMHSAEHDHHPASREGLPAPALGSCPAGYVDLDLHMLVIGYLSAVASRLDQRGIAVRTLHAQEPNSPTLSGTLTLDPGHTPGKVSGWAPARLRWEPDSGWSATLLPRGGGADEHLAVPRYLPGQLVPAPVTVAHFVAALRADSNTVWACATFRQPRRIDRRWLILQLARFALPEPW
jgi:hypothetical protein